MKRFVAVYFLTAVLCSCTQAKGFRFGDFFFGGSNHDNSDTVKRSSVLVDPSEELSNTSTTIPAFIVETELDPALLNSTFIREDEFVELMNSSSESSDASLQNSSVLHENDATTKQSVKKQLLLHMPSATTQSVVVTEQDAMDSVKNSTVASSVDGLKVTSKTDELEEVVLGTTKATAIPVEKSIFEKSIEWVKDTYTLSIVIPVAAGVLFATTCILTIAICGCVRRCCRRRRLRRKILPDSVKSLRASDRKRLLGDCSSDEEF